MSGGDGSHGAGMPAGTGVAATGPSSASAAGASSSPRFAVAGVAIDLDGTLLDTAPDLVAAANAMLAEVGLAAQPAERVITWVGKGAEVLVHRALTGDMDGRASPDRFAAAYDAFLRHYRRLNGTAVRDYPGVRQGLQAMRAMGLKLACVTNKPAAFTGPLLERQQLAGYFTAVVSGDTLARKKPDPAPMLHACSLLGLSPASVLAIGDSLNDALAARAAGMPVVVVPYGYNEGRPVDGLDVDGIVASLAHAATLIRPPGERPALHAGVTQPISHPAKCPTFFCQRKRS